MAGGVLPPRPTSQDRVERDREPTDVRKVPQRVPLPQEAVDRLMDDARKGANAQLTIDLETQEIVRPDGEVIKFRIDDFRRHCLLNGLDDIGLTMQKGGDVDSYEARQKTAQPWLAMAQD